MSGFVEYVAYDAASAKLRAAERERDAALNREALARDELREVHRVTDSIIADEREERAMAETYLSDQLEQARGIAVALEQHVAAGLALAQRWEDRAPSWGVGAFDTGPLMRGMAHQLRHALDPVAAELATEPDRAAS